MPKKFSYTAATNPAFASGGTGGPAADRGHAAPLPVAHAPGINLSLAGEVGPVASREEDHDFGRIFS